MSDEIKVRDYARKELDEMTAEELRHGALKWMQAEAKGEGRGDEKAARATEVKAKAIGGDGGKKQGKKALLARIQQLEQRLNGGNQ
ncbi:MAG: hypothetical protein WDO73_22740 [Ignavibacteriota bacterium]